MQSVDQDAINYLSKLINDYVRSHPQRSDLEDLDEYELSEAIVSALGSPHAALNFLIGNVLTHNDLAGAAIETTYNELVNLSKRVKDLENILMDKLNFEDSEDEERTKR